MCMSSFGEFFRFCVFFSRTICWPHLHVKDSFFPPHFILFYLFGGCRIPPFTAICAKKTKQKKKKKKEKDVKEIMTKQGTPVKYIDLINRFIRKKKSWNPHWIVIVQGAEEQRSHGGERRKKNLQDICFYFALNEKCGLKCSNIAIHLE